MTVNRKRFYCVIPGLAAVLSIAACSSQVHWKGTVVEDGDVTVVKNPKEPLYITPILELREELSLGGPDAEGDYAFVQIRGVAVDNDGTIYVLDRRDAHIRVFDASGQYVRTIGRKGQGPGELDGPLSLSIIRAKGELASLETRRMSFFKTDGTFLRHVSFKEIWALVGRVDGAGDIHVIEPILDPANPRAELKKLGPDAAHSTTLAEFPMPGPEKFDPFLPVGRFTFDRDNNLVYGYPATYEIRFFGAESGKVFRKILRDYDPVAVTDEEKEERSKGLMPETPLVFSKYHSAYIHFFTSDEGHLFVQTWEKTKDGTYLHDIFDAEGRFMARIPLRPTGIEILNGKYYAFETDDEGYQFVKRYAVTWTVKPDVP
ncbi:MAG: 6-bladed beta-propeller [Acidobacteriota bacterium]|nr:6-bladed beta-propeller [Acidobacteriota bacterium]